MSPIINLGDTGGPNGPHSFWEVTIGDYRYELFPNQRALVYKGDSVKHSYEITYSGCDCPSAVYGNRPCKHEKPISWRGDGKPTDDTVSLSSGGLTNDEFLDSLA